MENNKYQITHPFFIDLFALPFDPFIFSNGLVPLQFIAVFHQPQLYGERILSGPNSPVEAACFLLRVRACVHHRF